MKITIDKITLNEKIKLVSKAVSKYTAIPPLQGILLTAGESGIKLTASDSDISIETFINVEDCVSIEGEGSYILPHKEFAKIVQTMPEIHVEIEEISETRVKLTSGKVSFNLNAINGAEYPRLPKIEGKSMAMDKETLKTIIDKTLYAVSDSETRPILTGVNFTFSNNGLSVVATDAHRLSKYVIKDISSDNERSVTIPGKSLKELSSILSKQTEDVQIVFSQNQLVFKTEDTVFYTRLLEGTYPATDRLIPLDFKTEVVVERNNLLSSLERASILTENYVTMKISMKNREMFDTIEVSHFQGELGESKEDVIVDRVEGEDITLSFNPKYVMDMLKTIDDEKVSINFNGSMRPFVVTSLNNTEHIQLVLPVRTY